MDLVQGKRLPERQAAASHGMAIFALEQTAGRGQRGKSWQTEPGSNIILSLILKPQPFTLQDQFMLSLTIALGVRSFFARYAGEEDTKIKWPNDLYWRDRKAGGILIESVVGNNESKSGKAAWKWAIAGVGININQVNFPADLPNPVSLKQITGKSFDTLVLAKELCHELNNWLERATAGDWSLLLSEYNRHLYKLNASVKFRKGNRVFEGVVKSVTLRGGLRVCHAMEEEFAFGEIEWIIANENG